MSLEDESGRSVREALCGRRGRGAHECGRVRGLAWSRDEDRRIDVKARDSRELIRAAVPAQPPLSWRARR